MDTFLRNQKSLVEHTTAIKARPHSIDLELGDDDDFECDESKINRLEKNSNLKSIKALRSEVKTFHNSLLKLKSLFEFFFHLDRAHVSFE